MVFYFSSNTYHAMISKVISETEQTCVGSEVGEDILLKKYIREHIRNFEGVDQLIVDLTALADTDDEVISAFESLKVMDYDINIIVLAARKREGDKFLKDCFFMGIYNLVVTDDFLKIHEELTYCLKVGMKYKDALHFRDAQLQELEEVERKIPQKAIIGVIGASARAGCTHTSIVLANTLRQKGYMVAILEMNGSNAFQDIREVKKETLFPEGYFTVNGVDYYPTGNREKLETVSGKLYQFILLDFGCYELADKLLFHKCDIRIVTAGAKPWELIYLNRFYMEQEEAVLMSYHFCFQFAAGDKKLQKEILQGMEPLENIYFPAYTESPFDSNLLEADLILKAYLPASGQPKKKGLFRKK